MAVKQVNDKLLVISDAVLYWAKVHEPAPNYDPSKPDEWSVTALISKADAKSLEKMKINKQFKEVEEEEDGKYQDHIGLYSVKFTQPSKSSKGKDMRPPVVLGADGKPTTENIGNGSKGQVRLFLMEGQGPSKGKLTARLNGLYVQDLVEYVEQSSDIDGFDVDVDNEGFDDDDLGF